MLLDRKKLLVKVPLKTKKVELAELEGYVFVRQMTGHEKEVWESTFVTVDEEGNTKRDVMDLRAKLAVCTVCDEKGKLIFNADDWKDLSDFWSASLITHLANEAQSLNAISKEDQDAMLKNLEPDQKNSSTSD